MTYLVFLSTGFELTDIDIIAIARLRGPALRNFHFPASCIELSKPFYENANVMYLTEDEEEYFYHNYATYFDCAQSSLQSAFNNLVSMPLTRSWHPLEAYELPEFIAPNYSPQMTYQRTLLEDCNLI